MVKVYILCVSLKGAGEFPYFKASFSPTCEPYEVLHDVQLVIKNIKPGYKINDQFITLESGDVCSAQYLLMDQ